MLYTHTRPLPSTAASPVPHNDLLRVYVTSRQDEKSLAGADPAIPVCPMPFHSYVELREKYNPCTEVMGKATLLL